MNRIVSLALDEALVRALDREAAHRNLNRSELVNRLLAAHYGALSPAIKRSDVMERLAQALEGFGRVDVVSVKSGGALQYRSALSYPYRPKVRFILSSDAIEGGIRVYLRVVTRSTSASFCEALWAYFSLINRLEARASGPLGDAQPYRREGAAIEKQIDFGQRGDELEVEGVSRSLYRYLRFIQRTLDLYFEHLEDPERGVRKINNIHREWIKGGEVT